MPDLGKPQGVLYIHNAILGESARMEERLSNLDWRDESRVEELRSEMSPDVAGLFAGAAMARVWKEVVGRVPELPPELRGGKGKE